MGDNEMATGLINAVVVVKAARNLYDNRLGYRPGNPCWHAPKCFWEQLGEALEALNPSAPTDPSEAYRDAAQPVRPAHD